MTYLKVLRFNFSIFFIVSSFLWGKEVNDRDGLKKFEKLSSMQPKPFVIVEASGKKIKNRGQGVVVSEKGHVLSAAHIAWIREDGNYSEDFRISFRGNGKSYQAERCTCIPRPFPTERMLCLKRIIIRQELFV